ncbi:hypothetical protein BRD20_03175 [Halobacteriales archaeon SW_8_65_20]|nr:MAG: hypothetical protein BRD20_03175 [Halobacteriales archaeon SW_8_65_20]
MNAIAKRIHNVSPQPMVLTFADGTAIGIEIKSTEFFQETFQAEGTHDDTRYRFVSDGDDDPLVAARESDDGWQPVGEVVAVERIET